MKFGKKIDPNSTPFDLAKSRRWQPIHRRGQIIAHYKSIRKSILEARERDNKNESI